MAESLGGVMKIMRKVSFPWNFRGAPGALYNPEIVAEILEAEKKPPERTFKSADEMLEWLNRDDDVSDR